jgi:hypothetical protein
MEISQLLSDALSGNEIIRKQAESNIEALVCSDYSGFLLECAKVLSNEDILKGIRQISSTLIKNVIVFSPNHAGKWRQLPLETRVAIRNQVLSALASSDKDVRKAAAMAVAGNFLI